MHSDKPTKMVMCTIDLRYQPEVIDQALEVLTSMVERTEAQPGCGECSVRRDATDGGQIRYNEMWASEAAFQKHLQSDEFRRVLMAMDMCCAEPKVVVGNLSGHSGIAYLKKLREGTNA